jgi:hypothetical protein
MTGLIRDLHCAWRRLARNLGFPALTIMTLGVGIPASTAMAGVMNAVLRYQ